MPSYKGVSQDKRVHTLTLPTTKGLRDGNGESLECHVTVPMKLRNKAIEDAQAVSYRMDVEVDANGNAKGREWVNMPVLGAACVRAALLDSRTTTDIADPAIARGFTHEWIDNELDPQDSIQMGQELAALYAAQLNLQATGTPADDGESADPNAANPSPTMNGSSGSPSLSPSTPPTPALVTVPSQPMNETPSSDSSAV